MKVMACHKLINVLRVCTLPIHSIWVRCQNRYITTTITNPPTVHTTSCLDSRAGWWAKTFLLAIISPTTGHWQYIWASNFKPFYLKQGKTRQPLFSVQLWKPADDIYGDKCPRGQTLCHSEAFIYLVFTKLYKNCGLFYYIYILLHPFLYYQVIKKCNSTKGYILYLPVIQFYFALKLYVLVLSLNDTRSIFQI